MEISDGKLGCISVSFSSLVSWSAAPTYEGQSWKNNSQRQGSPRGCVSPVRARASRFICQWPGPVWYKLSHRWIYHLSLELEALQTQHRPSFLFLKGLSTACLCLSPSLGNFHSTPLHLLHYNQCFLFKIISETEEWDYIFVFLLITCFCLYSKLELFTNIKKHIFITQDSFRTVNISFLFDPCYMHMLQKLL